MQSLKHSHDCDVIREKLLLMARQAGLRLITVRGIDLEAAICGCHPHADDAQLAEPRTETPESSAPATAEEPPAEKKSTKKKSTKKPSKKQSAKKKSSK